jgi:hypothetical protein
MHNHSKDNCIILKEGLMIWGLPLLAWLALALLDFGLGPELRPRTTAHCQHLPLLLLARVYSYRRENLHEDANARF